MPNAYQRRHEARVHRQRELQAIRRADHLIKVDHLLRDYELAFKASQGRSCRMECKASWIYRDGLRFTRLKELPAMTERLWALGHALEIS